MPIDSLSYKRNLLIKLTQRCSLVLGYSINHTSPAPISKKKGQWTAVQVTVSKQLMFQKKSLWSDGAGKVAGKLV